MSRLRIILLPIISFLIIFMLSLGPTEVYADGSESSGSGTGSSSGENTEVKGKLISISYDPLSDSLVVCSDIVNTEIWCGVLKKEEGSSLQGKNFKKFITEKNTFNRTISVEIPLSDKKTGFNISDNKDAFFYVTDTQPESGKKDYVPNFIIHGCTAKLSKVELDYVAASKSDEIMTSAISSFVIKDSGNNETYDKNSDQDKFLKGLAKLAYGQCWDKEKYTDDLAYYKDDANYAIDRTNSTASNVYVWNFYLAGKLIYAPENVTGNVEKDVENGENWTFEYDEKEQNRLYRYYYTVDLGEDASEYLKPSANSGSSAGNIGYIRPFGNYRNFISLRNGSSGTGSSISECGTFGIFCKPQAKYSLDGLKFSYMDDDQATGRTAGYYSVDPSTGKLNFPLVSLEDYGLTFEMSGFYQDNELVVPEPKGISIQFEDMADAVTADDFGVNIYYRSTLQLETGAYLTFKAYPGFEFSNLSLKEMINEIYECESEGEKLKVCYYFRYAGQDNEDGKTAERSGKLVKVGIKKASKPVKITVDLAKDAVKIKNGFDFSVDGEYWYTILPFNKEGTAKSSIIPTDEYTVVKKVTDNSDSFTNEKISGIPIETLFSEYSSGYLMVRKSAKIGAPASAASEETGVELEGRDMPPSLIANIDGVDYLAASDDKDTIKLPKIDGSDSKTVYEYIIIDKKDFEAEIVKPGTIDSESMKWNKYKAGGKLTVEKAKGKYKLKGEDKASDHVLTDGSYVLVRKKGTKTVEKDEDWSYTYYQLASEYYTAQITKTQIEGKDAYIMSPANVTVQFYVNGKMVIERIIPRGGRIKQYEFPGKKFLSQFGNDTFVGWADSEDAETPNIDVLKVFDTSEQVVKVYAIRKIKNNNQESTSGEPVNTD